MSSMLVRSLRRNTMLPHVSRMAVRGGGFHKPDPLPYPEYKNTRRIHLEDINTMLYSDIGPEYHMHLHSIQI